MATLFGIVLFMLPVLTSAAFTWSSCVSNPVPKIYMRQVEVTPSPVVLPGNIALTLKGNLTETVNAVSLKISIKRKTFLGGITIPCLFHVGSCTYDDLCGLLNKIISENWLGEGAALAEQVKAMILTTGTDATHCPWGPGHMEISNYTIKLPSVPSVLTWFAAGDYTARIETFDKNNNDEQLLCFDLALSVKQADDGGFLFG